MAPIKIKNLVTFTSEDSPAFKAENLLCSDGTKKWRGAKGGEPNMTVTFQLEKPSKITQIDIGNEGSALIEVQVGRQSNPDSFKTILSATSFMTPMESRNEKPLGRVRMFGPEKLNAEAMNQSWDQVKVICTQPFNKRLKYGLAFITFSSGSEDSKGKKDTSSLKLGAFRIKDENEDDTPDVSVGSFFNKTKMGLKGLSPASELKSPQTLADFALAQSTKVKKDDSDERPTFYQLKKEKAKKRKTENPNSNQKLPRRDSLPGEKPREASKVKNEKTPVRNRNGKARQEAKTSDKKAKEEASAAPKATKPLAKLMEGVVFTISGIQNPERADIREKALSMGAKYRPDWDSSCTHLVCAFPNTPKFNKVKRAGGKIIKKDWILKCKADRKRYPWRRFCLDPKDQGSESEGEVWDEALVPSTVTSRPRQPSFDDDLDNTDDEIEAIKAEQAQGSESSDEAYDADTDVDDDEKASQQSLKRRRDTTALVFPDLPECFTGKVVFIYGDFSIQDRRHLVRLITAGGGQCSQYMSKQVNMIVTNAGWDADFDEALAMNPKMAFVHPDYVQAQFDQPHLVVSVSPYRIRKS